MHAGACIHIPGKTKAAGIRKTAQTGNLLILLNAVSRSTRSPAPRNPDPSPGPIKRRGVSLAGGSV
eukprot:5947656-Prymnesium_polylepis.1